MYGAEKFQEYLSTPSQQSVLYAMYKKKAWRTRSQPAVHSKERDSLRDYRLGRFYENMNSISEARRPSFTVSQCSSDQTPEQPQLQRPTDAELSARNLLQASPVYVREPRSNGMPSHAHALHSTTPEVTSYDNAHHDRRYSPNPDSRMSRSNGSARTTYYVNGAYQSSSPQNDSALDNSPSSDLSERGSDRPEMMRANSTPSLFRQRQTSCPIDLEAMERDAAVVAAVSKQPRWSSVKTGRGSSNQFSIARTDYSPYRQKQIDSISVSQI